MTEPLSPRKAFGKIIPLYLERKFSSLSNPLSKRKGPFASFGKGVNRDTKTTQATEEDFKVDVELAISAALRDFPSEQKFFEHVYINEDEKFKHVFRNKVTAEAFDSLVEGIETKVGDELIRRHIYPLSEYIERVDTR